MLMLQNIIEGAEQSDFRSFLDALRRRETPFFLRDQILDAYLEFCAREGRQEDAVRRCEVFKLFELVQELVFFNDRAYLVIRRRIGETAIYGVARAADRYERVPVESYLAARDAIILGRPRESVNGLEIDMDPFITSPLIKDPRNIGKGIYYLLRYLSGQLSSNQTVFLSKLLDFLKVHQLGGMQLMLNPAVPSVAELDRRLKDALEMLESRAPETPYADMKADLERLGFERGWGRDAARIRSTMELLASVLENPDHEVVGEFFSRVPMVHKIAIITPHGWFAQENVLGRPDTGGQVVYILNQVRALENELCRLIHDSGLSVDPHILIVTRLIPETEGTRCNVRLEDVEDTRFSQILRVPFRPHNRAVTDRWISRFEIWPYLDEFAADAGREVVAEMGGRPDLIVGNYSDGNMVAYLMSRQLDVNYCTIAHALEKAKYLYSDLNWKRMDDRYHFSLQFTADLIAMSAANITITSSYQEIAGTPSTIGQYESYRFYNMPGLYRVRSGANMFHPRYNIVPPGVDQRHFYPFTKTEKRPTQVGKKLAARIFLGQSDETSRFRLADPSKKPIYTIARLDHIKNITGLVEAFGKSDELRKHCNLVVVSGHVDRERSTDQEEKEQIGKMYALAERYRLDGSLRWLEMETDKTRVGEVYRLMADRRGVFVQPALFEAFGLTVLEAMISGLPTIATRYGGPLETIENGASGYHINPNNHAEVAETILPLVTGEGHEERWEQVSRGGVERVLEKYTWDLHAAELIKLAKIYGFWNFVTQVNTRPLLRYVETLYQLLYRPMALTLLEKHGARPAPHTAAAVLTGKA